MSYPPDVLNPDSLAEVLVRSCQHEGTTNEAHNRMVSLVELLVMYIPLDRYDKVLDEWAAQPEGKNLHEVVRAVVDAGGSA